MIVLRFRMQANKKGSRINPQSNLIHCCPILTLTLNVMQWTEDARTKREHFCSLRPVVPQHRVASELCRDENMRDPHEIEEATSQDDFFHLSRPNYNILPAKIAPLLMSGVKRAFSSLPEFPPTTSRRPPFTRASVDIKTQIDCRIDLLRRAPKKQRLSHARS